MRPFALDNMAITRGPMECDPETGKWIQPPDDVFFGTAVTVQCSPEDREEVIHIFQTVFDPRVPLKDVPHFVTWSFMQDIHEENAEATQDLRDSWVEAVKDHFQLAHHPSKSDKDTRQAYRTWTTTELMDLDTPNPQCDGATLRWLLMTMTHKDIKGQPVIRQVAHMVTDRSKVVLTCLTEHYDLMRECMGALPLVMLGFWNQPWGFFVPGTKHKMQMKYDFVNGEWKRRGAISYSATKRTRVEHNDQTLDLIERHLSKEVDDSQPVFSFTNIELVLNTAVARGQEAQANDNQGTLGSEQSEQTTRNDGTLQADSEATTQTRTRRREGDQGTLKSLNDTEDDRSFGTWQTDQVTAMEVDGEANTDERNPSREGLESERQQGGTANLQHRSNPPSTQDKHTRVMGAQEAVQWADQLQAHKESLETLYREKQATTAAFQGESRVSPSQDQTDTQSPLTHGKEKEQWADQSHAHGELGNTQRRTNDQAEAWSQAKHEHQHPETESDAGSVGSRDYPGAALERFEPGAQTFPTMRHQGRSQAFKDKWMLDATAQEVLELMEKYSVSIGQPWTTTRPGLRRKRWDKVWEVLQILRLMVSELRPEGWNNFGKYVGGRHPDALLEEAMHWMKRFPKLTVKDREMVLFPQALEDWGQEESESESEEDDNEVQVTGVKTRGAQRKQPATDSDGVSGEDE
jgi:hypothetical protein